MKTMIVNEVKKTLVQTTKLSAGEVQQLINNCKTYRTNNEPLRVDATDLKERLVGLCNGTYGMWNTLATNVCTTIH